MAAVAAAAANAPLYGVLADGGHLRSRRSRVNHKASLWTVKRGGIPANGDGGDAFCTGLAQKGVGFGGSGGGAPPLPAHALRRCCGSAFHTPATPTPAYSICGHGTRMFGFQTGASLLPLPTFTAWWQTLRLLASPCLTLPGRRKWERTLV
jgi:hypothetical protein